MMEMLVELPERAGRVVSMADFRGDLLIVTEHGYLYKWDGAQLHTIVEDYREADRRK